MQLLGEGGMGVVWVAEQVEPVKRRVALKVIKPGMDSAQVLRRFEAERQALALMDHTNIAKVFDAGTTDAGRPYFVMELVHGVPLTRYCDELHLPIRERLELFVPVCQAIQHAHQKGVIHRDIKPSNVLVCMQDGKPVPKVIDFGVAKAISQQLTEQTLYTEYGAVVGTLEYMAPEQAEMSPLGADTRADVYALGVLLYELLTGSTPLDRRRLRGAAYAEMLRIIKEEEPPRPSTRLNDSKESLPSLAAQRRTEPGRLAKAVRGELDWIAMKCLEKDRTRRYETASAVARDVERHLHDEPVEACPPSAGYRLRKTLRRHRGPVVATGVVVLVLVVGIVGTGWGMMRARNAQAEEAKQRQAADKAREETEKANGKLAAKNGELIRSQDRLEGTLARTWLSPLAGQAGPLSEPEISALEAVAAHRSERMAMRFLREGVTDPFLSSRLRGRAAYVWHAAVGLDEQQRAAAEKLLNTELRSAEPKRRLDLALAAGELGDLTPATAELAAAVITKAMSETTSPGRLRELATSLAAVATRLKPEDERTACNQATAAIAEAIGKTTEPRALRLLVRALSAVAARLTAKNAATTLVGAMNKTEDADALQQLAEALSHVAARLDPSDCATVCRLAVERINRAMKQAPGADLVATLGLALSAVASRLDQHEIIGVCGVAVDKLARTMSRTTDTNALMELADGLSALVAHLGPNDAERICGPAAATLTHAMAGTGRWGKRQLALGLSALADRLAPSAAAQACGPAADWLSNAVGKTTSDSELDDLAQALCTIAGHLAPDRACALLAQAMQNAKTVAPLETLGHGLSEQSGRLLHTERVRVCAMVAERLTQALSKNTDEDGLRSLALGLSMVADRLDRSEAARVCALAADKLSQAIRKTRNPYRLKDLAETLSVVARRLESEDAARRCGSAAIALTQALGATRNGIELGRLARGISEMAAWLTPKDAARTCGPVADMLRVAISNGAANESEVRELLDGLSAVAMRLEPQHAASILAQAMSVTTNTYRLEALGKVLSAIVIRFGATRAPNVCAEGATKLFAAMADKDIDQPALLAILSRDAPTTSRERLLVIAGAVPGIAGEAQHRLICAIRLAALPPVLPPLPAQTLVDLLKLPLCVGQARRVVLAQLGRHYRRSFTDQWDFLRYVHEHMLKLDVSPPPRRLLLEEIKFRRETR